MIEVGKVDLKMDHSAMTRLRQSAGVKKVMYDYAVKKQAEWGGEQINLTY
jgi:hypothetical protein